MSDELVVLPPIESNRTTPGTGLIDHINDLNGRVSAIEGGIENIGGPFLPLAGGVMTGYLDFANDGQGIHFYGGGAIYKRTGLGMILQKSSGGQQWMVENADGTGGVAIATLADIPEAIKGDKGDTGEQGIQGDTGEVGPDGPKGDTGDKGEQGATGPAGEQGVPGVDGASGGATVGDIKAGFQTADHAGWIILDGRAITALTATQQTAATTLGFTTNLPDALNAVPLQNMGVMGTVSGSTSITLTEAQMPSHHHEAVACTNDEGTVGFSELLTGDNFPATICWRRPATIANQNNHNLEMSGRMMLDVGSGAPIDITPKSMAVNQFVYLGA